MKNYYDELEVSKTASKEVIEKVYKVLAKKYHPDTTKEADKQFAEEKFKIISEAYQVLSDVEKRKKYDIEFEQRNPTISYEDYMKVVNQRDTLNNTLRGLQNEFNQFRNSYNAQRTTQTQYQQNPYNQTQYRQAQFNQQRYGGPNQNFNNGFNNYQTQNPNYSNPNNGRKKKKYYYNAATGQPVSTFDYYKYKIRKFLSNLWFYIILGFILITLIKNILSSEFNQFFI